VRRVHLLEFHDQPWFPALLRDHVTDALHLLLNLGGVYRPIVPRLAQALRQSNAHRVVDLCSGAGGPWPRFAHSLQRNGAPVFDVLLSDKYPHAASSRARSFGQREQTRFHPDPVDATHVPAELTGFRTIFNSFHHFPPPQASGILRDAVEQRQAIGVFESPGRHFITILLVCLLPLFYFLLALFQCPFRWSRLFFTYVLPVIPFVLFFDGIVSCLRVYSPRELHELVATLPSSGYSWQIGVERGGILRVPITYLVGLPDSPAARKEKPPAGSCANLAGN
jgi:hypothetical protein